MYNLPNMITLLRIVLIPLLVIVFYLPWEWRFVASGALFSVAAATDWLDGYLARKLDKTTPFGAFLDPVADKLIVAVALVVLLQHQGTVIFAIATMIIIGREIVVSALREWMAELGQRASVGVSNLGKIKTGFQMTAIIVLLTFNPLVFPLMNSLGLALLYVAALLTLWSMLLYLKIAWPEFQKHS